mgnify:FL=1
MFSLSFYEGKKEKNLRKKSLKNKLLSVCMITADSDDFVYESLSSVYEFADEIIVVDNNSQDNTLEILHSFPQTKMKIISRKFEGKNYQEIVKQKRNICLSKAKGNWLLVIDPDEIYKYKDMIWMLNTIKNTRKIHLRYNSVQFWRDYDHVIVGPHWDDSQERCIKNLSGLKYDKFAFSVSVNGEILAKKYGKKYEDGIYWAGEAEIRIFHYGYATNPWKIKRKITNYLLSDNPMVNESNIEQFVLKHPYFSGHLNQPRHGSEGLWIAGIDNKKQKEEVHPFQEEHPESMGAKVEEFRRTGKMPWEIILE